jgi:hypothetical protein
VARCPFVVLRRPFLVFCLRFVVLRLVASIPSVIRVLATSFSLSLSLLSFSWVVWEVVELVASCFMSRHHRRCLLLSLVLQRWRPSFASFGGEFVECGHHALFGVGDCISFHGLFCFSFSLSPPSSLMSGLGNGNKASIFLRAVEFGVSLWALGVTFVRAVSSINVGGLTVPFLWWTLPSLEAVTGFFEATLLHCIGLSWCLELLLHLRRLGVAGKTFPLPPSCSSFVWA